MPNLLYLLRHGQTEWSANGKHTSHTDLPLTEDGQAQASAAGEILAGLRAGRAHPRVFSSPRTRALDTADRAGLTVDTRTEQLAEWDYGDYEGRTTERIRADAPGWTIWSGDVPGGESADAVSERADRLLRTVRAALADTDIILVGHGHFSRVLVARWLELPATEGVRFAMDPGAVTVLGHERGEPRLDHLNVPPITKQ